MAQEQLRVTTAHETQNRKPRVVIIGAGIAGLSAANRLQSASTLPFELTVLEASDRAGGRIRSSKFAGEQIELGATWIHGIEGSPIYEIVEKSGGLEGAIPWERMDGNLVPSIVKAEGGFVVDPEILKPIDDLYKKLLAEVRTSRISNAFPRAVSVGSFLREGLKSFFLKQENANCKSAVAASCSSTPKALSSNPESRLEILSRRPPYGWDLRSLQEGIFRIHENHERQVTAADSLYDLDLESFREYWEFPGKQIIIPKGFSSVVDFLSKNLSAGTLQFSRKVEKICWKNSHFCSNAPPVKVFCADGSNFEADHVIITVSLGVLKAETGVESENCVDTVSSEFRSNLFVRKICHAKTENGDSSVNVKVENAKQSHSELFDPPLPSWKLGAIRRLGFGVVDKLFVKIQPFEGGQRHRHMQFIHKEHSRKGVISATAIPHWMSKTSSLYPIHRDSQLLQAWFSGKEALQMESLTEAEILQGITDTLSSFEYTHRSSDYVTEKPNLQNGHLLRESDSSTGSSIKCSRWGTDPLFRGSYSYVAVGSSGSDIDALGEAVPRGQDAAATIGGSHHQTLPPPALQLLFAGEATHRHHYSTTHGAYISGAREADRLLTHYGR